MRRLALALGIIALLLIAMAIWQTDNAHENAVETPAHAVRLDSIKFRIQVRKDSTARAENARLDSLFLEYHRQRIRTWSLQRSFARSA